MTGGNWLVLLTWAGLMAAFVAAIGVWDAWLARRYPGRTISWSMALMGQRYPLFVFWVGFACAVVLQGLASHFWPTMIGATDWDQVTALQATVDQLRAQLAAKGGP